MAHICRSLGFFILSVFTLIGQTKPEERFVRRVINPAGWSIPGLVAAAGLKPSSTRVIEIDGTAVQESHFRDVPVLDERHKRFLTARVLSAAIEGESVIIREIQLAATAFTRYSVRGKPFLYMMMAYPCDMDEHGTGGCAPADTMLAYYDEDGDGKFEVEEFPNPILSSDPAQNWKPRLPAWAKATQAH